MPRTMIQTWRDGLADSTMSRRSKLVGLVWSLNANSDGGNGFPGGARLARRCSSSQRVAYEALGELEEHGWLICVVRGRSVGESGRRIATQYQAAIPPVTVTKRNRSTGSEAGPPMSGDSSNGYVFDTRTVTIPTTNADETSHQEGDQGLPGAPTAERPPPVGAAGAGALVPEAKPEHSTKRDALSRVCPISVSRADQDRILVHFGLNRSAAAARLQTMDDDAIEKLAYHLRRKAKTAAPIDQAVS